MTSQARLSKALKSRALQLAAAVVENGADAWDMPEETTWEEEEAMRVYIRNEIPALLRKASLNP